MAAPAPADTPPASEAQASGYAWYVLSILFLVYILNFVDRQIISILAEDIKRDLHLTDADLAGADLIGADLRDARVPGAKLADALFLTQFQINAATGDARTTLPQRLTRPSHWL